MPSLNKRKRKCPKCGFKNASDNLKCGGIGCTHKFADVRPYHVKWKNWQKGGQWDTARGFTDKERSLKLGESLEFSSRQKSLGVVSSLDGGPTLDEHLTAYHAHLKATSTSDHPDKTVNRIKKIGFKSIAEIMGGQATERLNKFLAGAAFQNGQSSTRNHYRTAIKGFARWLNSARGLPSSPLAFSKKEKELDKPDREILDADEVEKLLTSLKGDESGLTAAQRFSLYVVALNTGFRAKQLSYLTASRFDLAKNVVKSLPAENKAKRLIHQPLKHWATLQPR
jgi:hypothetical protein